MATTAIFPLHIGKGRSVAKALKGVIDYLEDPYKTDFGEFVSSYECSPETADLEFGLAKEQYLKLTGRSQGKGDVIAYHARMSFAPGEVTPAEANRLGYELAQRFTKGKFAYVVTTHTNSHCVHNHIVWNSTRLDFRKKFRNFIGSAFALRRCSDMLCLENGLSVVKNPQPSPGKDYAKYMYGKEKPTTFQDTLRAAVDGVLAQSPSTFEDFLALVRAAGITAERRGTKMRLLAPGQKQFTRLETLGDDYSEAVIRDRIAGRSMPVAHVLRGSASDPERRFVISPARKAPVVPVSPLPGSSYKPNLLIDIQAKIQEGKGAGYAHWASVRNLKQMAKTLLYLQDRGLDDYGVLKQKTAAAKARFDELSERMKVLDEKLTANAALQKHIVTYAKTRQTYIDYRKAGYSKTFRATHETDIILHQAAKKAFDELGIKKLPTVASLRAEYAPTLTEKKQAYAEYRKARDEMRELIVAKDNVDRLLGWSALDFAQEPAKSKTRLLAMRPGTKGERDGRETERPER
ncbi:hypothetical protein FACS189490_03860 [Clostridia bacterium]|nr:hypothetical protein FACS189490_03860 [Clostridia bacterium]